MDKYRSFRILPDAFVTEAGMAASVLAGNLARVIDSDLANTPGWILHSWQIDPAGGAIVLLERAPEHKC